MPKLTNWEYSRHKNDGAKSQADKIALDNFWLLAALSAIFGALLTTVIWRKLSISRIGYGEARQLLSAMISSLSTRIQRNELLVKELADQVQTLAASQGGLKTEVAAMDKARLLEYMQDWVLNLRRFVAKVETLQKNLKDVESQVQELHVQIDRADVPRHIIVQKTEPRSIGAVTQQALSKLTPTERQALDLLVSGPKAAPEIGRLMTKSREHTARLMKSLFEQGFVERETQRQPYQYGLNDKIRETMAKTIEQRATEARY